LKKITKDNKGITLIALVITIVLMLILVSVTTYTGIDIYNNSRINKFVTQMKLIQSKVDDLVGSKTEAELELLGQDISSVSKATSVIEEASYNGEIISNDISTNTFRYFSDQDLLENLDIEDITDGIIINFTTREVISLVGIEYKEKTYYTQYKLPGGQIIIDEKKETNRDLSFNINTTIDGLNATITISDMKITNGTLSYREIDSDYWTTITNYTKSGTSYDVVITKSATYEFKLTDNATGVNSNIKVTDEITGETQEIVPEKNKKEIKLTNKPNTTTEVQAYNYALTSENWAYMQKESINYVWIPRFKYKINAQTNITEIKFIKGNSNIATDNTYLDNTYLYNTWNVHDKFTTDSNDELTGIWISVNAEEVNQAGLNMLTLLNDSNRKILIEI